MWHKDFFFLKVHFSPAARMSEHQEQRLGLSSPGGKMLLCATQPVGTLQPLLLLHWWPARNLRVTP